MATATVPEKAPEQIEKQVDVTEVVKALQGLRDELKAAQRPVRDTQAVIAGADKVAATAVDDTELKRFGWSSMGEQLKAVRNYYAQRGMDERLKPKEHYLKAATGLGEAISSDGGFLLAPEFAAGIREIMHNTENLLDRTDSFSIGSNSIKLRAIDETSRATGSRRGGVRGFWVDEGDPFTASKPKFRQIELKPYKLQVVVYVTEELLDDGGSMLEQYISKAAAEEINFLVGDAIINGEGAGKPLGILLSDCLVSVAKEAGQPAATIVSENIAEMWKRLHAASRGNAVWLINQDTERQLHLMNVAIGTSGQLVYMPPGGLSQAMYATLYGRPVVPTEFNPTLGTQGDVILADMSQYVTATKGAIKPAMSMHVEFLTDQMVYRFTFRIDGKPWWNSALTPFKGSATQSPFVVLDTRA
jgi:HK97 family phage major capsid protein